MNLVKKKKIADNAIANLYELMETDGYSGYDGGPPEVWMNVVGIIIADMREKLRDCIVKALENAEAADARELKALRRQVKDLSEKLEVYNQIEQRVKSG